MTDSGRRARPDVLVAGGCELDGLLGPLAAYLGALEARVGALERRLSAVPLMTAADAAAYARVNVETILRAVRAGELSVAGYVGRSPRISRDAVDGWLVEAAWRVRLNLARQLGHGPWLTVETYGHVMDELDHAPRLAAVDAIMQARSGPPPERPGLTVSSV